MMEPFVLGASKQNRIRTFNFNNQLIESNVSLSLLNFSLVVRFLSSDPKGEKAAAAAKAAPKKKSKAKKGNIDDLDTLLDVGLKKK